MIGLAGPSGPSIRPRALSVLARRCSVLIAGGGLCSLMLANELGRRIAYFTCFPGCELARFRLPSSREARSRAVELSGEASAAELPQLVSQKYVEAVVATQG